MADVIFDVDGTLMNIEHRRHHVQPPAGGKKNWKGFVADTHKDTPNHDVVEMAKLLKAAGNRIIISSGRFEDQKEITEQQLAEAGVRYDAIYLRANKDNRSDDLVKADMLEQMKLDGFNPTMAYDDRDRVCAMWRANGIRCFQVAPGDF